MSSWSFTFTFTFNEVDVCVLETSWVCELWVFFCKTLGRLLREGFSALFEDGAPAHNNPVCVVTSAEEFANS